jgi:hypothetical protein
VTQRTGPVPVDASKSNMSSFTPAQLTSVCTLHGPDVIRVRATAVAETVVGPGTYRRKGADLSPFQRRWSRHRGRVGTRRTVHGRARKRRTASPRAKSCRIPARTGCLRGHPQSITRSPRGERRGPAFKTGNIGRRTRLPHRRQEQDPRARHSTEAARRRPPAGAPTSSIAKQFGHSAERGSVERCGQAPSGTSHSSLLREGRRTP